jgi:hypothetical protein
MGKPSRVGVWNNASPRDEDRAAYVNKSGLVRASIEGEDLETFLVVTLAECDGHEFVNFEGIAASPLPSIGFTGARTLPNVMLGMALVTAGKREAVFVDGSRATRERTEEEKRSRLAAWRA